MLYGGLARLGTHACRSDRARRRRCRKPPAPRRLMEPVAAWYVGNVLLGTPPPENAAGGRIAFKTGTSYGYRDAWSVGFDGKRTIGVWVGRPDGAPVPGLVGRAAAAPILFDAFARTGKLPAPLPQRPKARCSPRPPSCRRRCSASGPAGCPARAPSRRCATMESAAPPGSDINDAGCARVVEHRMAKIPSGKLVHRKLVEVDVRRCLQIDGVAGRAVEGEAEAEPIALGAALGASLLWRPGFGYAAGYESVTGMHHTIPRGNGAIEVRFVSGGMIEIDCPARCIDSRGRGHRDGARYGLIFRRTDHDIACPG